MFFEIRWKGGRILIARVIYGDGSAYEGQDVELFGWTSGSLCQSQEKLASSRTWTGQSCSACSCSFESHELQRSTSRTAAS